MSRVLLNPWVSIDATMTAPGRLPPIQIPAFTDRSGSCLPPGVASGFATTTGTRRLRLSPNMPPLPALRAFEAAARLMSFRRAGEELLITQSAVSHHIGELEKHLEVKLFLRKARGVDLTPEGERYFETVRRAFDLIHGGTADLKGR